MFTSVVWNSCGIFLIVQWKPIVTIPLIIIITIRRGFIWSRKRRYRPYGGASSKILNMGLTYQAACRVQFNYLFVLPCRKEEGIDWDKTHSKIAGGCRRREKVNKSNSVKEKWLAVKLIECGILYRKSRLCCVVLLLYFPPYSVYERSPLEIRSNCVPLSFWPWNPWADAVFGNSIYLCYIKGRNI